MQQEIYIIHNNKNNKKYIGKSKNAVKRFKIHLYNAKRKINRHLYDAINHHGKENFYIEILDTVDCSVANDVEKFYIHKFESLSPNGYNMTKGGDGGYTLAKWSDADRAALYARQGEARKGRKASAETKALMSAAVKERYANMTPEQKSIYGNRISITLLERGITPPKHTWYRKGSAGFRGKHTEQTKLKLSNHRKGKTYYDIMGSETADMLKEAKRVTFSGSNNPKFVDFGRYIPEVLKILTNEKVKMYEIANRVGCSLFKLREWCRIVGVTNYQQLYSKLSYDEWINFWRTKCE